MMHEHGKSDRRVVPTKPPNKGADESPRRVAWAKPAEAVVRPLKLAGRVVCRVRGAGDDGTTVLWDWRARRARARLDHGRGRIVADYHPDGSVLATGSSGRPLPSR